MTSTGCVSIASEPLKHMYKKHGNEYKEGMCHSTLDSGGRVVEWSKALSISPQVKYKSKIL